MTSPRQKSVGKANHDRLIAQFAQADRTVTDIAQELGLDLSQLAAWVGDPATLSTLERLARLADIHAQMVVSRYRANAAAQLIQIATAKEPSELSRKACVDLLAVNLNAFDRAPADDASRPTTASPRGEAAIRRALEQLGRDSLPVA